MNVNVFQVQRLLKAIGKSPGNIDGIWGPKSQAALDAALKEYENTDTGSSGAFWADIRHFRREEFRCKCHGKFCNGFPVEPEEQLVRLCEKVRNHFGKPAIVSSGIRCEQHNANVGGKAGSRHRLGKAVDFRVDGVTAAALDAYIGSLPEVRFHYSIDENYCHMDIS